MARIMQFFLTSADKEVNRLTEKASPTMKFQPRLFEQINNKVSEKQYSVHTKQAYITWINQFIIFHRAVYPENMGITEIKTFLNHLAVEKNMAASTRNQALNALLFLYKEVLGNEELAELDNIDRAVQPDRLPIVLTNRDVQALLARLEGQHWLMASLLYGSGLRLMECIQLRVKDVQFYRREIIVRNDKGRKDRATILPDSLIHHLQTHLEKVKALHIQDLSEGFGEVNLPEVIAEKCPNGGKEWEWQYIFPATKRAIDPFSGTERRNHIDKQKLQRAVKQAAHAAKISQSATCHTLRHSFAAHALQNGYNIHTVQKLLGHKDISRTKIYTKILNKSSIVS